MDLFSVTCTTCKSRLKVREERAVGQILACPKCGGMVMVKPPAGWQPGAPAIEPPPTLTGMTAPVDLRSGQETLSESHFDDVDDLLSDAPPKVKPPAAAPPAPAPSVSRPRFVGAPPQPPPVVAKGDGAATATLSPPPVAADDDEPSDSDELDSQPDWQPQRPWRYWLLLSISITAGIALALAVVLASINFLRGKGPPPAVAQGG
jgi:DNA-directed RNA polymerase subunit RPC12/RpoP